MKINKIKKSIALARIQAQSDKIKIHFSSGETLTKDDIISNIENETEIGKKLVDLHIEFLQDLASGKINSDD